MFFDDEINEIINCSRVYLISKLKGKWKVNKQIYSPIDNIDTIITLKPIQSTIDRRIKKSFRDVFIDEKEAKKECFKRNNYLLDYDIECIIDDYLKTINVDIKTIKKWNLHAVASYSRAEDAISYSCGRINSFFGRYNLYPRDFIRAVIAHELGHRDSFLLDKDIVQLKDEQNRIKLSN